MIKKLTFNLLTTALISSAMGATLDVNDPQSIAKAHQAAAANLIAYYTPNAQGTIPPVESEGRNGFQWFEMGMLWGSLMDYTALSGDGQVFKIIAEALGNAGFGSTASFIGPKVSGHWPAVGRWNDDIGWWAFPAISGAEIKGRDAVMSNGVPFLTLAMNSWEQMNEGVNRNKGDEEICRGGVFWHRNRAADKPHLARLLSTVTTAQYIFLSVRIYEITGDKAMLQAAKDAFDWLFKAKLIGDNGEVYDGVYNPRCWQIEKKEHSYNAGLLLGAAARLTSATKDNQYLERTRKVFTRFKEVFTVNDIIIDECEPTANCKVNQASFKGIAIRGLGQYYQVVSDAETRTSIKSMIQKSAQGMSATCNDNWACNTLWTPKSPAYSDVHTQNTALELLNALYIVSEGESEFKPEVKVAKVEKTIKESPEVDSPKKVDAPSVDTTKERENEAFKGQGYSEPAHSAKYDVPDQYEENDIQFSDAASTFSISLISLLMVYMFTC